VKNLFLAILCAISAQTVFADVLPATTPAPAAQEVAVAKAPKINQKTNMVVDYFEQFKPNFTLAYYNDCYGGNCGYNDCHGSNCGYNNCGGGNCGYNNCHGNNCGYNDCYGGNCGGGCYGNNCGGGGPAVCTRYTSNSTSEDLCYDRHLPEYIVRGCYYNTSSTDLETICLENEVDPGDARDCYRYSVSYDSEARCLRAACRR
jgi:hypothetical protein